MDPNHIVAEHGGSLWIESELGEWTRFHMDLLVNNEWAIGTESEKEEDNNGKYLGCR